MFRGALKILLCLFRETSTQLLIQHLIIVNIGIEQSVIQLMSLEIGIIYLSCCYFKLRQETKEHNLLNWVSLLIIATKFDIIIVLRNEN